MTQTYFHDTAIEIVTPDASVEIDCEYVFTYSPGYPEQGPTYDCGGEPAEGPEIEVIGVKLSRQDPVTKQITQLECPEWLSELIADGADRVALFEAVDDCDDMRDCDY